MELLPNRPLVVYLDMNVWVSMTKGCANQDTRWKSVRVALDKAVSKGQIIVPLSAAHYLELWHRREQRSREQVGAMMRDLTGYVTINSTHCVRRRELRRSISQIGGINTPPLSTIDLLGRGAVHAFGSPYGRFRFVESLASSDGAVAEGPVIEPPEGWTSLNKSGPHWEWFQLVGTPELLESEGVDRTPEHRYGTSHMSAELAIRERFKNDPQMRERRWDILVADEIISLLDEINEICEELDVDPHGILLGDVLEQTPPEAGRNFIASLPSAFTWVKLRDWKHRDLTHPWEQHDWTDISALSVVVPYCDVVITERRWAHIIKATGLGERYDTDVGSGLRAVEVMLSKLA